MPSPLSSRVKSEEPPERPLADLPVRDKLEALLELGRTRTRAVILTHDNPDPDSLAAAVALAFLLEKKAGLEAHVAYGGIIGRSENLALVKVLRLPVSPVSQVVFDEYDLVGVVDTQPSTGNHSIPARYPVDVVVDHHPLRDASLHAPFADVGGDFGASSTMLVEYLRAARLEPSPEVATALFYGIKTDSRDLGRQTTPRDVEAYLWLFPKVDKHLLGRIEHPDLPAEYFRLYHLAIERAKVYGETVVVTDLKDIYSPDMVAEVAERLMFLEGMKWSLAYGTYEGSLYLSLRVRDRRMNAGRLMRELCENRGGSAGGHGSMAGARVPLPPSRDRAARAKRRLLFAFLDAFGVKGEKPRSLLAGEQ
ncbi:MAG TPA: DHHA1 domain-containing protein [Myxococcaceae bacterium]|nr:DHHA1 domain-containing protein [Myxococcaceae bacterium]